MLFSFHGAPDSHTGSERNYAHIFGNVEYESVCYSVADSRVCTCIEF
jgi:hypothetical protein